ncbi:MAG: hypothetical protein K2O56_03460 [Muribaculaceae bacterium]|nr:hypothetical protein [Muribaculaceae bacterium]
MTHFRIPPKKDIWTAAGFLVLTAVLAWSCAWVWEQYLTTPPYVDPERYPVRGIDVSSHNGDINLRKARKDGIDFVFIKASEGADFKDKNFVTNHAKALKAGMKTGAYHFFRFDKDGVDQAMNFLEAVGNRKLDLGLAIDIEKQGNPEGIAQETIVERLITMAEYLYLKGHRVTFYTNIAGYEEYLMEAFPGYPLWICSFSGHPIDAEWTYWQYDHHGKVNGIRGDVDLNTFNGTREEFESIGQ